MPGLDDVEDESAAVGRSRLSTLPRGLAEGDAYDESLPSFYVIPMKGQMGTDIRLDAYEPIISEIRAEQYTPDDVHRRDPGNAQLLRRGGNLQIKRTPIEESFEFMWPDHPIVRWS